MIMKFNLLSNGKTKKNADWFDISSCLKTVRDSYGNVRLEKDEEEKEIDLGAYFLDVLVENSWYLITLLEVTEDGTEVRSYYKPDPNYKIIELNGNKWSTTQLTQDFNLVLQCFKEFYETGDVSKDILDFD